MDADRPLPHHPELERYALGAVLRDNGNWCPLEGLTPGDFFIPAHRRIFSAMASLVAQAQPVAEITLCEMLKGDPEVSSLGGVAYIARLADGVHNMAPVADWAEKIRFASVLRQAAYLAESIKDSAIRGDMEAVERGKGLLSSLGTSVARKPAGVLASEVLPERVKPLWPGRIFIGKPALLDGDPGVAKSTIALDLAARVTTGRDMPDGSPGVPGGVVILSAEDGTADTIVPRLLAAGANLERVRIIKTLLCADGERIPELPLDIPAVKRAALSVEAKLVVIDPLMAYLPEGTNSYRDQDVRRALAPLAVMAEEIGAAVLIVRHLNKSGDGNPLYRGGGSIGIIGAARSGLLIAPDPDDETGKTRVLAVTKSNLSACPPSLRFTIEPYSDSIRICWQGESSHRASALLSMPSGDEARSAVEEAKRFLESCLGDGPVSSDEVLREARRSGFSDRTIDRAKKQLGATASRQGFGRGGKWTWTLPPKSANPPPKSANSSNVALYEQSIDLRHVESINSPKGAKKETLAPYGAGVALNGTATANRPVENSGGDLDFEF